MEGLGNRLLAEIQRRSANDGTGSGESVGGQDDNPVPPEITSPPDTSSSGPGKGIVTFNKRLSDPYSRALVADDKKIDFTWEIVESANITKVVWCRDPCEHDLDVIALAVPSEFKKPDGTPTVFEISRGPFLPNSVDRNRASLRVETFPQDSTLSQYFSDLMLLRIYWETPAITGFTSSGMFTVVTNREEAERWYEKYIFDGAPSKLDDKQMNGTEKSDPRDNQIATESNPLTSAVPSTTGNAPQGPTSAPEIAPSGENGGRGGLSTGVIVGIAVGGAAALIILITAIFLVYRRRHHKRQAAEQAGYDSQQGATVFFADKETSRVPETPQTPYSEDGGHRLPLSDMPGVAITHDDIQQDQQQQHLRNASNGNSTFIPYKNPEPATSRTDLAVRSGTATPLGLSSNIAHLVEDGMTEDEIRRLEEEERQLDDAIAQARRR